jgi:hypothetical protein
MRAYQDIESRLRAHMAAERSAMPVPPDLESRVMHRLERGQTAQARVGVGRQILIAAALVVFALGLAFGISRLRGVSPAPGGTSPTAPISSSSSPTPVPITSPRPATAGEYADMVRAGKPGAEQSLGIPDCGSSQPGPGHDCFTALPAADAIVGTRAGYFHGSRFGSGCWVYLFEDENGWHFVDVRCGQAPGTLPRINQDDTVSVSGCANVRAEPSLQSTVLSCVPSGTNVHVVGGPVYRDGKLWWQLQGKGWMVHDSLVS